MVPRFRHHDQMPFLGQILPIQQLQFDCLSRSASNVHHLLIVSSFSLVALRNTPAQLARVYGNLLRAKAEQREIAHDPFCQYERRVTFI